MRLFLILITLCFIPVTGFAENLHLKTYVAPQTPTAEENEAAQRAKIWAQYKALAAGTDPDKPDAAAAEPAKDSVPTPSPADTQTKSPEMMQSLFGTILQKSQQTKSKGGQLKSLTITPPTPPKAPEPVQGGQALE